MDPLFIQILNRYPPTFIRNIWKLNEATIDSVADVRKELLPVKPFASVQIRRGDKLRWSQIQSISAESILNALPDEIRNLFVATDDYSVIEELENLGIKNIYTFCTPKHRGSDVENDHFLNGSMVEKKTEVLRLITDIDTCVRSKLFLRVRPNRKLNSCGHGRNYQISDMISDLRRNANEIILR